MQVNSLEYGLTISDLGSYQVEFACSPCMGRPCGFYPVNWQLQIGCQCECEYKWLLDSLDRIQQPSDPDCRRCRDRKWIWEIVQSGWCSVLFTAFELDRIVQERTQWQYERSGIACFISGAFTVLLAWVRGQTTCFNMLPGNRIPGKCGPEFNACR